MTEDSLNAVALKDARRRGVIGMLSVLLVSLIILVIFRTLPEWDTWLTRQFFESQACPASEPEGTVCGFFPLTRDKTFSILRGVGLRIPALTLAALGIFLLIVRFVNFSILKRWRAKFDLRLPFWGFLSGVLGTIVITNWTLKENWGRPRPWKSTEFGGELPYVPPGTLTDYCDANCSFVSGEATAAFWLIWFAFFFSGGKRIGVGVFLSVFAIAVSGMRVAFGAHYISDVLMGGCVAWFSIALIYWLFHTELIATWLKRDRSRYLHFGT